MIRINLRPEIKFQTNYKPFIRALVFLFFLCFSTYFSLYSWSFIIKTETETINKRTATKRNQLEEMRKDLNKLEKLQVSIKEKKNRTNEIKSLNQRRKDPIFVLDRLQQKHMETIWLEKISYKVKELKVSLIASAKNPALVADYISKLRLGTQDARQSVTDYLNFEPDFLNDESRKEKTNIDFPKVEFKSIVLKDSNEFQLSNFSKSESNFQKFNLDIFLENKEE